MERGTKVSLHVQCISSSNQQKVVSKIALFRVKTFFLSALCTIKNFLFWIVCGVRKSDQELFLQKLKEQKSNVIFCNAWEITITTY